MSKENSKADYSLAINYAELGRVHDAFERLEKCFELREERLVWMNVEPRLSTIRNDPRFESLIQRLNFRS